MSSNNGWVSRRNLLGGSAASLLLAPRSADAWIHGAQAQTLGQRLRANSAGGAIPGVMSSPPAFTNSANLVGTPSAAVCASGSLIPSGVLVAGSDPRFTYRGGSPVPAIIGENIPNITFVSGPLAYVNAVEIQWNGAVDGKLEFYLGSNAGPMNLLIDGKYVNGSNPNLTQAAGGNSFDMLVDFGGPTGTHTFRLEQGYSPFYGIRTDPGNILTAVSQANSRRQMLYGDSWIGPSPNTSSALNGPAPNLGKLLGYPNTVCSGQGGTGYLNNNGGAGYTYRQRAAFDIYPYASLIDSLIVFGSSNDGSADPVVLQAEASTWYTELRSNLPGVPITIFGVQKYQTAYNTAQNNAIKAAAQAQAAVDSIFFWQDQSAFGSQDGTSTGPMIAGYITSAHPTDLYSPILAGLYRSAMQTVYLSVP